jgi:Transcriptional regulator
MGRWEPDARGRLARAALDLYAEQGFDRTTVAEIAERGGVTERTFFRYFADKREALFDGSNVLQQSIVDAIAAAPESAAPIDVVGSAMAGVGPLFHDRREYARKRAAVIAATPNLQERELLKLADLAAAVADALRARGVADPSAGLLADTGVTVFKAGFEEWVGGDGSRDLGACVVDALARVRALTAPT